MSELKVGGYRIDVPSPEKVLFPSDGITRAELVDYYHRVGPIMLRHIRDRPVIMQRFPEGIDGQGFIQQQVPEYFPEWIERAKLPKAGGVTTHAVSNHVASIVYMASQAVITLHTWLSRANALNCPDLMIFDLDPDQQDFEDVRWAAVDLRHLLHKLGLATFVKTTGLSGAHVVVPLDRSANFDEVRVFARAVADELVRRDPGRRTSEMRKEKRGGRLFVDVMRNAYGQAAVAPYSVRAAPAAPVAMPLAWSDFESQKVTSRSFTIRDVGQYVKANGDAWSGMARHARSLRAATRAAIGAGLLEEARPRSNRATSPSAS